MDLTDHLAVADACGRDRQCPNCAHEVDPWRDADCRCCGFDLVQWAEAQDDDPLWLHDRALAHFAEWGHR